MDPREFHVMNAELSRDRQTMRYTCPTCRRCMEDGPDGIAVLFAGDRQAVHRAGTLKPMVEEVEPVSTGPPRRLH